MEGQDKHSVTIEFQDNVWVSTVTRDDGTITTLRCDVDGFHFTVSKAKGADVPDEKVYVAQRRYRSKARDISGAIKRTASAVL